MDSDAGRVVVDVIDVDDHGHLGGERVRAVVLTEDDQLVERRLLAVDVTAYEYLTGRVSDGEELPVEGLSLSGEHVAHPAVVSVVPVRGVHLRVINTTNTSSTLLTTGQIKLHSTR